jgi:bacteriocin-like protein
MQDIYELIELTECELDAVSGGNPFSINISAFASVVRARINSTLENNSAVAQENSNDSSIHVSGD